MKRLTLLRHAKSSWRDAERPDIDRPLNSRGEHDAPRMGGRLKARGLRPSLILTSPARRARATAKLVARALGYPLEFLQPEPALYLATPEQILGVVAAQDERFGDVLLVGHNPGLSELVCRLLPDFEVRDLPTCAVVTIDFEAGRWAELESAPRKLVAYDFPKNPEPAGSEPAPSQS